jgi:hypothetical protein
MFKHYKAADWKETKHDVSHHDQIKYHDKSMVKNACCDGMFCTSRNKMCFRTKGTVGQTECKCISHAKNIPKGMVRHKEGDFAAIDA